MRVQNYTTSYTALTLPEALNVHTYSPPTPAQSPLQDPYSKSHCILSSRHSSLETLPVTPALIHSVTRRAGKKTLLLLLLFLKNNSV